MKKQKKKVEITTKSSEPYKKGDFCYYVPLDCRVYLGEVQKKLNTDELIYSLIDQHSYKFVVASHESCFDNEKQAKLFAKNIKKQRKGE
jgi:hypothetical protein